jgi:4-amino-4-deoxy-L-arabinose transferase-like glycosyltransferase
MHAGAVALVTAAALVAGVLLWVGWWYWHQRRPLTVRSLFAVVLGLGVLCRIAYVFLTPIFYAPDEQSHFNYIKYLAENHALPIQAGPMGQSDNEWEYFQPPLYYLTLVPLYRVVEAVSHGPATAVVALRLCSVLLSLLNVRLGLILLKRLEVKDEFVWLSIMTLACLLPTYTFVSSAINNDNLMIPMGTVVLCLMARRQKSLQTSLVLGALLGLALWVKQSAIVFFPAIGLLFLLERLRQAVTWRKMFWQLGVVFGLAALIYSPWAARNWHVYGTFTPEDLSAAAKTWPSMVDGIASAAHNLVKTFWSVSGISNNIGYPFPLFGMGFGLVGIAGLAIGWKQNPNVFSRLWILPAAPVFSAFGLAVLVNVILVLRFGYLYGMGQGRHLFPLLFPIGLLLAAGMRSIPVRQPSIHLAGFWITYALAFQAFSLCHFPR